MIDMGYLKMYQALQKVLRGESVKFMLSDEMAAAIELWGRMYKNRSPWLKKREKGAGLPAAISAEIARLITLELDSKVEGSEYLDRYYQKVMWQLRIQTEYGCAKGGIVFKPYPTENGLALQYVQADNFFPLEYDTDTITRAAFLDQFREGDNIYSRFELHTLKEDGIEIQNRAFLSRTSGILGSEVPLSSVGRWAAMEAVVEFPGAVKLPFGYFKVPLGNTDDPGNAIGVSVFSRAVGHIQEADKRYSQINWEYESKEAAVHIAQSLLKYNPETDSFCYPGGKERLYRAVDYNAGAADKPLIDIYSPDIRDASLVNGFNQILRLVEFGCNLAYGTLSDPSTVEKTAEEIKASKQRSYSFIESCQTSLQHALEDLVDAMAFWADRYGFDRPAQYRTTFVWDDSIVVDTEKERSTDRADVAMGAMQLWEYRMKWYGEDEETAKAAVMGDSGVIE